MMKESSTWATLSAAPHRLMFFTGMLQFLALLLFWSVELIGRHGLLPHAMTSVPPTWAHLFLLLYGLFPSFFFGFLFTTYPRWMNGEEVPRSRYVPTFALISAGVALFYAGLFTSKGVAVTGVILVLAGLATGIYGLLWVYFHVATRDKRYETWINVAWIGGWLGAFSYLLWLFTQAWWFLEFARHAGIWLFLLPVLTAVGHRMIPFFSRCALQAYEEYRPDWSLPTLQLLLMGHLLIAFGGGRDAWLVIVDLPLAAIALWHSFKWRPLRSLEVKLLAVLHIAFLWFGIGMGLYALQELSQLLGWGLQLGRGPLHALGLGFIASMLVAMVTRVSRGHSGRTLETDAPMWIAFAGLQLAALLRTLGDLPPLHPYALNTFAVVVALAATLPWIGRYVLIYLRPRIDGRPG